jgi:pre-60S factor REI1
MVGQVLTCTACQVSLVSQEQCREHYRTEFHTYNLKRKLVDLPPVSSEVFDAKVAESQLAPSPAYQSKCATCHKTFGSQKVYETHMASRKHRDAEAKQRTYVDRPETGEVGTPSTSCVFCNAVSSDIET